MLDDLYQEIILYHNKSPRNYGVVENYTHEAFGNNAFCGDSFRITTIIENDHIKDIKFTGDGCAISKASASIMTASIKGNDKTALIKKLENLTEFISGESFPTEFKVFEGVLKYPIRVKCFSVSWRALEKILCQMTP